MAGIRVLMVCSFVNHEISGSLSIFLTVSGLLLLSGSVEGKQCLIIAFLDCRMTLRRIGKLCNYPTCHTVYTLNNNIM